MVDNLEIQSTASSEISESLREQILGKSYPRRARNTAKKNKSNNKNNSKSNQSPKISYESSFEVVPKKDSFHESSFEVVPKKDSFYESSFEVVPKKGSSFEIVNKTSSNEKKTGELSYHTAPTGSNKSLKKEDSWVLLPKDREINSMNEKRYNTIQTQTVAIQTVETGVDVDLDCRCCWEGHNCVCQECDCPCKNEDGRKGVDLHEDPSDFSNYDNCTETSSQTINMVRRGHCTCNHRPSRWHEESSFSDSGDSCSTDFFDLPYQNNEEYLKLLRELEKKLVARNRERVRRTMMEFERRSRQNQNLEKPIDDFSDDGASMLRRLSIKNHHKKKKDPVCCRCGRNKKVNSDILQNEKTWDDMTFVRTCDENDRDSHIPPPPSRIERSLHKSHWQIDPRSGEWVKVSCIKQTDFSRPLPRGDYAKENHKKGAQPPTNSGNMYRKECKCRHKSRH